MYNRRLSVLTALMKEDKITEREGQDPLRKLQNLFGKTFCEDLYSDLKAKQKYQEVLRNETKSSSPRGKTPFRMSTSASRGKPVGDKHHKRTSSDQHHRNNMVIVLTTPYLNVLSLIIVEILKIHPLIKNLFDTKAQHAQLRGRTKFHLKN